MANEIAASIAALGMAISPALLKFAEVSGAPDIEADAEVTVECVSRADAPVHARYQSTGTVARLAEGAVVQVTSKRHDWRRVVYVLDNEAHFGWITTTYLEPCAQRVARGDESDSGSVEGTPSAELAGSPHVSLGIPVDDDSSDDLLLDHGVFVLSYNEARRNPNWVAWKLTANDLGDEDRKNDFRPDDDLPPSVFRVLYEHFSKTVTTRGTCVHPLTGRARSRRTPPRS